MRLIFAGTPEFARVALAQLHAAGHDVALVLTQPDRPGGRGLKLLPSAVKQFALEKNLPLCQPRSLRLDGKYPDDAVTARAALEAANAQVMVVAAYGLILPQWVLDVFDPNRQFSTGPPHGKLAPSGGSEPHEVGSVGATFRAGPPQAKLAPSGGSEPHEVGSVGAKFGCLNIHASLLPRWRGAAPIHRAVQAGDKETGITIMQMDAGLDTGDMLLVEKSPIGQSDTTGDLHDALAVLGAHMVVRTLALAETGALVPVKQPTEGVSYAKKIDKSESAIDWNQPADAIVRHVLALNPAPGASAEILGETLKVWRAEPSPQPHFAPATQAKPGQIVALSEEGIAVRARDSVLAITEIQRPGGKRLAVGDFLRGSPLQAGDCFAQHPDCFPAEPP